MSVDILPALERAKIPKRSGLALTRTLSPCSCFIDRPYRAASTQASGSGLPGPSSRYERTMQAKPASYISVSRTEPYGAFGEEDFSGGVVSRRQGIGSLESRLAWRAKGEGSRKTLWS